MIKNYKSHSCIQCLIFCKCGHLFHTQYEFHFNTQGIKIETRITYVDSIRGLKHPQQEIVQIARAKDLLVLPASCIYEQTQMSGPCHTS